MSQAQYEKIDGLLSKAKRFEEGRDADSPQLKQIIDLNNDQSIFEDATGYEAVDLAKSLDLYRQALVEIEKELEKVGERQNLIEKQEFSKNKISEIELKIQEKKDKAHEDALNKINKKITKYNNLKTEFKNKIISHYNLKVDNPDDFVMPDVESLKKMEMEKYGRHDQSGLIGQYSIIISYLEFLENNQYEDAVAKLKALDKVNSNWNSVDGAIGIQVESDKKQYGEAKDKILMHYSVLLETLKKESVGYDIPDIESAADQIKKIPDIKEIAEMDAKDKIVYQYKATKAFTDMLKNPDTTHYSKLQKCNELQTGLEGQVIKMDREWGGWKAFNAVASILALFIPAAIQMYYKQSLAFWKEDGDIAHSKVSEVLEESIPSPAKQNR